MSPRRTRSSETSDPGRRMLVGGSVPALVAAAALALVGAVISGAPAALGALAGGVLAAAFFGGGLLALDHILRAWAPGLALPSALIVYFCQLLLMVAAGLAVAALPGLDRTYVGLGVLVATLAWMGGQLRSFVTARVLVSDVPLPKAAR